MLHLHPHSAISAVVSSFCSLLQILSFSPSPAFCCRQRLALDNGSFVSPTKRASACFPHAIRHRLVWRCQLFLWSRSCGRQLLGCLAMGRRFLCWPRSLSRYWMGRGSGCRARAPPRYPLKFAHLPSTTYSPCPGALRQCWCHCCCQQRAFPKQADKRHPAVHLLPSCRSWPHAPSRACRQRGQHFRSSVPRRPRSFLCSLLPPSMSCSLPTSFPPARQADLFVMPP